MADYIFPIIVVSGLTTFFVVAVICEAVTEVAKAKYSKDKE